MRWRQYSVGLLLLALAACGSDAPKPKPEPEPKPKIVTVFACSDFCPGPMSSHLRQVYEGVSDEQQCRALGGCPFVVSGWGTTQYCGVDGIKVRSPAKEALSSTPDDIVTSRDTGQGVLNIHET